MCGMLMNSDLNKQIQFSISLVHTCFGYVRKLTSLIFFIFLRMAFFFLCVEERKKHEMMQQESCG